MLGVYRHYKGYQYEVIGRAVEEGTLTPLILYRAYPQTAGDDTVWARSADDFFGYVEAEKVVTSDSVRIVQRFQFQSLVVAVGS